MVKEIHLNDVQHAQLPLLQFRPNLWATLLNFIPMAPLGVIKLEKVICF